MDEIYVSIIILTRNAGSRFSLLLNKIYQQQFDRTYEVVIVDSGSTDDTLKIAGNFPLRIVEIKSEEFHHGRTRNLGAKESRGEILVYITQDAVPENNSWLKYLTEHFSSPDIAMVVGKQIAWQEIKPPEQFFYYYHFPDKQILLNSDSAADYHDNMFISDVNSAIRKDVWAKLLFSDDIIFAEDKDLAARMIKNGWQIIYEPSAAVFHAHNFTIRELFQRAVSYGNSFNKGGIPALKAKGKRADKLTEYFYDMICYLKRSKSLIWFPYCIYYEFIKNLGFQLGLRRLVKPK